HRLEAVLRPVGGLEVAGVVPPLGQVAVRRLVARQAERRGWGRCGRLCREGPGPGPPAGTRLRRLPARGQRDGEQQGEREVAPSGRRPNDTYPRRSSYWGELHWRQPPVELAS